VDILLLPDISTETQQGQKATLIHQHTDRPLPVQTAG
jgi:hypothetical protein